MKILSWNVNGIRAVVRNGHGQWIHNQPADILCMQEVKATREQGETSAMFQINYRNISWDDTQSRAG